MKLFLVLQRFFHCRALIDMHYTKKSKKLCQTTIMNGIYHYSWITCIGSDRSMIGYFRSSSELKQLNLFAIENTKCLLFVVDKLIRLRYSFFVDVPDIPFDLINRIAVRWIRDKAKSVRVLIRMKWNDHNDLASAKKSWAWFFSSILRWSMCHDAKGNNSEMQILLRPLN